MASVAVAVLSLHADMVRTYSPAAFWIGVALAVGLAAAVGRVVSTTTGGARMAAATVLPTLGGAFIGVVVQAMVYWAVRDVDPVRDLGGLIDTTQPAAWLAGGLVLGGVPALAVALFLVLAARALKRLVGHDAPEAFAVGFTGVSGVVAAFGLVVVRADEAVPLVAVVGVSFVSLVVALLVDGARLRFLREAFAGGDGAFEIAPAERFAHDPTLAPIVAQAGADRVLLHVDRRPGSYRAPAAAPIALLADTEEATTSPLRRRRVAATALLVTMTVLACLASVVQGLWA